MNIDNLFPKLLGLLLFFNSSFLTAQSSYQNFNNYSNELKVLEQQFPDKCKLESLTKTIGGYNIWVITLSNGNHSDKPAIAIVAGVEGSHLIGPEIAFNIAENILQNHSEILENTTFYIFPNMVPNATENYFSSLKYYSMGNAKSTDADRDGLLDEDSFDDLNNDGIITLMRVEDPTGNYISFAEDERVMVKADKDKGELGTHKVFSEGIDSDKDELFNEDGKGGVLFNKNFTYKYPDFAVGAGAHPVSENESRALLDFLYEQWNLYAIITLGPANNLSSPLKYNVENSKKRVVSSILKNDASLNEFLSKKYNEIIKAKDAPKTKENNGGFFEWSYYHFGKLALSTPGWWVPKFKGDSINKGSENKKVNFLKWAEQENLTDYFVDWTEIDHPDFPNNKVEIGGIIPYKMTNPPYEKVDSISLKHTDFIVELTQIQQKISIENIRVESVGNKLTRISLDVYNQGILPTHTEMGEKSRWLRKIKLEIDLNDNQKLISGKKIELINAIDGDSSLNFTWLVQGNGIVNIEAGTSHTGTDTATIDLK